MPKLKLFAFVLCTFLVACGASDFDDGSGDWNLDQNTSEADSCSEAEQDRDYLSRDAEFCSDADISCPEEGTEAFYDPDCGCGCADIPPQQPDCPDDAISADSPEECNAILSGCGPSNDQPYSYDEECGCFCEEPVVAEPVCPDESDGYDYLEEDPEVCESMNIDCSADDTPFSNECGCGCRDKDAPQTCLAQDAVGVGETCPGEPLFRFDGEECTEIGDEYCYCEGSDCTNLTHTRRECEQNFAHCIDGVCEAMDAEGDGMCDMFFGWAYRGGGAGGEGCVGISGCECEGDDCDELYETLDECLDDNETCRR